MIKYKKSDDQVVVDNSNEVATIEGGTTLTYDEATIFEIVNEIEKIRNEVIQ